MKNFALIGVGGYIAPRHFEAINDTGNRTVIANDVNDSVGILDRYSQDVEFYTNFNLFADKINSFKGTDKNIDYISICSPNFMHKSHIKFGLEKGCDVICEKPLVLNESDIDELVQLEKKLGKKVYTVLQLRVHESIKMLKEKIDSDPNANYDVELTYITSRGPWYHQSWKGDTEKSGGLPTNIGVHFFDMLYWLFGDVKKNELHVSNNTLASGYLEYEKAKVKWILSVDKNYLPQSAIEKNNSTFRSIKLSGEEIEFSGGFTDLHTKVYQHVLDGKGYGLEDARVAVRLVEKLRSAIPMGVQNYSHQMLKDL